jgi:hypothetical protein
MVVSSVQDHQKYSPTANQYAAGLLVNVQPLLLKSRPDFTR